MTCNKDTCPDYTPNGRALPRYSSGVRMTREVYPERNTKEINVPSWDRDCVMYNYQDLCQSPTSLFFGGGETTTTDPETGTTTTTAADQDQFDSVSLIGSNVGKFYKSLSDEGNWWENRCPIYTVGRGAYSTPIGVSPFKYRYWDHVPSELSFEPNYSDSPFLYLFDTKEHMSGMPCHAICWTLVIFPGTSGGGASYNTYRYTPIKKPYFCDQTPDESYISYSTEDGKLTGPDEKDENPLIHSVGTRDTAIVFRFGAGCGTNFADVSLRLIGLKNRRNFRRLGRWQKALSRLGGSTDQWVFTEAGSLDSFDILTSKDPNHRYTTDVEVRETGTNALIATVNITARPSKSKNNTDFNDAEIRVNSLTVGTVESDPDVEYDFRIPRQANPSDKRYIGKIRFTNAIAFSGGDCSQNIDSAYSLFVGGSGDSTSNQNNYIAVDLSGKGSRGRGRGVGIVNKLGTGIWGPGNSGRTVSTRTFKFDGSQAIHGGTTGKKLKVKIRMEKFSDEDGASDTRISILKIIKPGYGYVDGQVFPIQFTANGTQYTVGYFRIGGINGSGGVSADPGPLEMGVPTGFRLAEPKLIGGVYAVSHSTWTSWANQYAVWTNNRQENLTGRSLEVNHHGITLPAGTYQVELGFDDSGILEIRDSEESTLYYSSGNFVGGIPSGSPTIHTGSFTLTQSKTVDIFVDVANAFIGDSWETNPGAWALVLKNNGNIVWTTRTAINGVNVGDAYRGMLLDETPFVNSWDGSSGEVFLSPQGNNVWQSKNTVVYKDYSFPGGLKVRMKISAVYNTNTNTFNTAWQLDQVLSYGSGYGAAGRSNFSEDNTVWGDQDVFYLYYPSTDTPKENRIGIALMISETQDLLLAPNIDTNSLPNGSTVNGWTVEGVQVFDENFNVAYAKLSGGSNDFTKDTVYTASNGQNLKVLAGFGVKDRAALFGKYEFTKKQVQYGTAFITEGVPFEPELIKPQVSAIINNGRVVGAQILKRGTGLSNRNIEPVRLVVDPPPTEFNHALYNQLILQGVDVVAAIERCTGPGKQAQVDAVISGGKLTNVIIRNGGSGYSADSPPKISVPYIVRKQNTVVQQASNTQSQEPDNQILLSASPVYKNFNLSEYNSDQQINYNEVLVSQSLPDIMNMELSGAKIKYEYDENYMDPNWSDQFNTTNRKEYKFTQDTQNQYNKYQNDAKVDSENFINKTKSSNTVDNLNINQEINRELSQEQRQIANTAAPSTSPIPNTPDNLPVGTASNIVSQLSIANTVEKQTAALSSTSQLGPDGNLDHYTNQFRQFLAKPVERTLPTDDTVSNTAVLDTSENILNRSNSFANSVISRESSQEVENRSRSSLSRGFDQNILNQINSEYRTAIDKIPFPKTPDERKYELNATTIRTAKGGFYKLPCATNKVKYMMQNFCPDPREFTWINIRLGVRINPDPINPDIGKCTRCLLDDPVYASRLTTIQSKDPNANIADAFCDIAYPISSIFGDFIGYVPYTKSYLWGRAIYGQNDDAIVEGIRSWEISGNLQILHDLTQETKTFVDAVNKYGNPYNFICGRSYGDLGENVKFDETQASVDEDLEVPDQLADTSIDNV